MSVLGLSGPHEPAVGLRQNGERRNGQRRGVNRGTHDRRTRERRRARLRSLILSALAIAVPQQLKSEPIPLFSLRGLFPHPGPRGATRIDSFDARPAAEAYDELIQEAAEKYRLSAHLIKSVMSTESSFNALAVSPVGAMGLMQLMPEIAKAYGVDDPFDPRQNVMAGAQILKELMTLHRGNLPLVLASYNAGAGVVARYRGIPPFRETRDYVKRVSALYRDANAEANNNN
jgi:soluble lytic murein transglycosylase-like protein